MSIGRSHTLSTARKLLRTLDSAPDPRRQARLIHSELAHGGDWTRPQREVVDAFGAWLLDLPPIADLRPRCERVLAKLG
jgi:nitrous oxide reductase accessory protein NosL